MVLGLNCEEGELGCGMRLLFRADSIPFDGVRIGFSILVSQRQRDMIDVIVR